MSSFPSLLGKPRQLTIALVPRRNRKSPAGYRIGYIPFYKASGTPIPTSTSQSAVKVVLQNADNNKCPSKCFRPVGIAFDKYGRLFFSSDASGEIYVLDKED